MINFDTLGTYVKSKLQEIVNLQKAMADAMENAKYIVVGGNKFAVDQMTLTKVLKQIQSDYMTKINNIHAEIAAQLAAAQKTAYQEKVSKMPRPTADERGEIADLIRTFEHSDDTQKVQQFITDRDFHLENETRLARIYVFAGKELGITKAGGQMTPKATDVTDAEQDMLERISQKTNNIGTLTKLEQDELLIRISPDMKTAQAHVDTVADVKRFYEIFQLQGRMDELELYTQSDIFNNADIREHV